MDFIPKIKEAVESHVAKKVAIQIPDGLRAKTAEIVEALGDVETVILSGSNFGACDLRDREAVEADCDLLIHVGHVDFGVLSELPVEYVPVELDLPYKKVVEKAGKEIKEKKIGLVGTAQHVYQLPEAKEILEKAGKEVVIGNPSGKAKLPGQILGCDPSAGLNVADKVDAFIYLGTGNFHPLYIAIQTDKTVYIADPEMGELRDLNEFKERILKQRLAKIEKAKEAEKFAILVTTKKGQHRIVLAEMLKEKIEQAGKQAMILLFDDIKPETLLDYKVDVYVNTACPRIPTDDPEIYDKPILTQYELEIVLGMRNWKDYKLDHF